MKSIIDLLKSHTSIRKFKDQPIEESLLLSLLAVSYTHMTLPTKA